MESCWLFGSLKRKHRVFIDGFPPKKRKNGSLEDTAETPGMRMDIECLGFGVFVVRRELGKKCFFWRILENMEK